MTTTTCGYRAGWIVVFFFPPLRPSPSAQVLWRVGVFLEQSVCAGHIEMIGLDFEVERPQDPTADVSYPCYHPTHWRQTERELCRYAKATQRFFQDGFPIWNPPPPPRPSPVDEAQDARCASRVRAKPSARALRLYVPVVSPWGGVL